MERRYFARLCILLACATGAASCAYSGYFSDANCLSSRTCLGQLAEISFADRTVSLPLALGILYLCVGITATFAGWSSASWKSVLFMSGMALTFLAWLVAGHYYILGALSGMLLFHCGLMLGAFAASFEISHEIHHRLSRVAQEADDLQ